MSVSQRRASGRVHYREDPYGLDHDLEIRADVCAVIMNLIDNMTALVGARRDSGGRRHISDSAAVPYRRRLAMAARASRACDEFHLHSARSHGLSLSSAPLRRRPYAARAPGHSSSSANQSGGQHRSLPCQLVTR